MPKKNEKRKRNENLLKMPLPSILRALFLNIPNTALVARVDDIFEMKLQRIAVRCFFFFCCCSCGAGAGASGGDGGNSFCNIDGYGSEARIGEVDFLVRGYGSKVAV